VIAFLYSIPVAGNVMLALSATLTVYLSESAKRHRDPTISTRPKPPDQLRLGPVAAAWFS